MRELTDRFGRARILIVGDPILDEYVTGDCTRLSPEAPIPVLKVRETRSVLGGAANTAANVASLGGHAVLVGVIGSDDAGRRLADLAAACGVSTRLVQDQRPTSRKVRALGGQQQLLRLDYEDDAPASRATQDAAMEHVRAHLADASVLVVSDYAKGLVDTSFCQQLITEARAAGIPVVVDPRPQHAAAYVGCDYLTPNWKEAQALLGASDGPPSKDAVTDVGRRLAATFGANILLTLGPHGLRYFGRDGRQLFDEPAQAREVFDVSGAGDTVVAAFALATAVGADVQTALRLANLAAGVVVAKVGTATVSRAELVDAPGSDERIVDGPAGVERLLAARAAGRRVGVVTGTFEVIHAGNLDRLRDARRQVDLVVVDLRGASGDVRTRARVLLGLRDVDFVYISTEGRWLADTITPDLIVDEAASVETGGRQS